MCQNIPFCITSHVAVFKRATANPHLKQRVSYDDNRTIHSSYSRLLQQPDEGQLVVVQLRQCHFAAEKSQASGVGIRQDQEHEQQV